MVQLGQHVAWLASQSRYCLSIDEVVTTSEFKASILRDRSVIVLWSLKLSSLYSPKTTNYSLLHKKLVGQPPTVRRNNEAEVGE